MIDLHTHTAASDGTDTPAQIIDHAVALGLEALAITDHDTFRGSDEAIPLAAAKGLRFVRGLELSTRQPDEANPSSRSVQILGYFFEEPSQEFRDWLETQPWDKTAPGPALPPDVVEGTQRRYVEAFERITDGSFARYLEEDEIG